MIIQAATNRPNDGNSLENPAPNDPLRGALDCSEARTIYGHGKFASMSGGESATFSACFCSLGCIAQMPLCRAGNCRKSEVDCSVFAEVFFANHTLPAKRQAGFPQLIVQGVPNWSISMPKRDAQNDSCSGICTVPCSARVLKMRTASAAASRLSITEKPCGLR